MKILGIIPSRYQSTRFPGKPLTEIQGKSMIRRVYEQVMQAKCLYDVVVATDDERIYNHVKGFDGKVVMTSADHKSGTERCGEVLETSFGHEMESVINIQGDEPFIDPGQIDLVGETLKRKEVEIATLAKLLSSEDEIGDPNVVKVVFDLKNKALYFSRNPIPFLRSVKHGEWAKKQAHFKHIGIYGYKSEVLTKLVKLPVSALERSESLEQLRWLENGYKIDIALTDRESVGIDIPEDLSKITNNT